MQSDLLAVHFPTPDEGWAVGHDGVVLHSTDGGVTWAKQLDGRMLCTAFREYYERTSRPDALGALQNAVAQLEQNCKDGFAPLPFLDVWFENTHEGFVVGSFGMIAATTDGGKTWEPWLHRIDNSQGLNFNAIRDIEGHLYIAGEKGEVYRLDRSVGRFTKTDTGYTGSFFGIAGNGEALIAFGLRGVAYRSVDGGMRWEALTMPADQTITAGVSRSDGEGFVLVNVAGQMLLGDKSGKEFRAMQPKRPTRATGIAPVDVETYAITGLDGVQIEIMNNAPISGSKTP